MQPLSNLEKQNLSGKKSKPKLEFELAGQTYIEETSIGEGSFGQAYKVKKKNKENIITSQEEKMKLFFEKHLAGEKVQEEDFVIKKSKQMSNINEFILARLILEGDMIKKMFHPNIITVLENEIYTEEVNGEEKITIQILMEYANSGSLLDLIKKSSLGPNKEPIINFIFPENRVWRILTQISLGLNYLHSHKIIHRDIKPNNILLFDSTYVKITDFGESHELRPDRNNFTTMDVGAGEFRAPEISAREYYDFTADIWSLGVTIYYLCTKSFPLGTIEGTNEPIIAHLHYPHPIKVELLDKYSLSLQELILQMLTYEPTKRITVENILKHPKIASLIKRSIVRKKLLCSKYHKLKFVVPKRELINTKDKECSKFLNQNCSACSQQIIITEGFWTCNLCPYLLCSNDNQMEEIQCYLLHEKDKWIIDLETIPYEIQQFSSKYEKNEDLPKLYKLVYMENQLALKSSASLNLMINLIINHHIPDKSVFRISENDVNEKPSGDSFSEALFKAKIGCNHLMKSIQKNVILCRSYLNKFKYPESKIFSLTLMLKCFKNLTKLCLLDKDYEKFNSIYSFYLTLITQTIQTYQYDKLFENVEESNIFRLKFEILFNQLEINKYLVKPLIKVNNQEDLQGIIQYKIYLLHQSKTENELLIYRKIFETNVFSYASKEEEIRHNYIFKYLAPRSIPELQVFANKKLRELLKDFNF